MFICLATLVCFLGCDKRDDSPPASKGDAVQVPAGIPAGAEPVVAMVKFRPYRGFIDTPIVPSDLVGKSLIAKLGELLNDPKYDIEKLKSDCLSGKVLLNHWGFDILRKEGVKESDINVINGDNIKRVAGINKDLDERKQLDDKVKSLGVFVNPPAGWQEPFVIGNNEPFLRQLVMGERSFSPIHHMAWIDSSHQSTQGEIEVIVFAAGGFPIGVIAIAPERWIRTGGSLSVYKLDDGEEVIAGPAQFGRNNGYKVRCTFEKTDLSGSKKNRMTEDAVYFSNDKVFVAVRLRSLSENFENMDKSVFRPFLSSIILQASTAGQK